MIRSLEDVPADVLVSLRFAQALWPNDPTCGSEATALAWGEALGKYSVDQLCPAFERLALVYVKMPALSVVLDELRQGERKAALNAPLLEPPAPLRRAAVPPALNPYRQRLRADLRKFHRGADGKIDAETLAEIDARVNEVGEHEQRALDYIEANPDADYGRVSLELVNSWLEANFGDKRKKGAAR